MSWKKRIKLLHGFEHPPIHNLCPAHITGTNRFESDCGKMTESAQFLLHKSNCRTMIRKGCSPLPLRSIPDLELKWSLCAANPLNPALGENALRRHFKQAELEGSAADIGNQNSIRIHYYCILNGRNQPSKYQLLCGSSLTTKKFAESDQIIMRTRNHVNSNDFTE